MPATPPPAGPPLVGVFTGVANDVTGGDDAFVRMLGMERDEFDAGRADGRPLSPPEWVPVDEAALRRAASSGGSSGPYQKEFWHAAGHRVPALVSFVLDPDRPGHWVGYAVDLSSSPSHWAVPVRPGEHQPHGFYEHLVGELVRERSRISSMLDGTDALVWVVDAELRLVGANSAFWAAQRADLGRAGQIGDPAIDPAYPAAVRREWEARYRRALAGERFETHDEQPDRCYDIRVSPVRDSTGEIVGAAVVGTDVTAQVRTRRTLEQREQLLRIAGRLGRVAGWIADVAADRVTISDELVELFDVDGPTEISVATALGFYRTEDRPIVEDDLRRCQRDGTPIDRELPVVRPDGTTRWVRLLGEALRDDDGAIVEVGGAIADITDRRTTQGKLREQASLLDNATDAILVRDLDGIVTYWNRAAEALYGWTSAEAIGRHIADLVDAGDMEKYARIEEVIWREGEWTGRLDNVDRHGDPVVVELHVNTIRDERGHPIAVFSVANDITERVQLEEHLSRAQKLDAVGQLTGGIAHDFNNLLTVISGSSELLGEALADDPELAPLVEMVRAAADRGADLTARLLAYARRQPLRPEVVDAASAIDQVLALLRRSFPETVSIEVDAEPGRVHVVVDPSQLETALLNVALNARDAMGGRGRLLVAVDAVGTLDGGARGADPPVDAAGAVPPGGYGRIAISDDGPGMAPDVRARAFDPFFTTKPTGEGSGLGLSMVYGFARQSGGHVELHSAPGEGTTVALLLPLAADGARPEPYEARSDEALPRGHERILVVEDDPLVRAQTVRSLRRLGYEVTDAVDADEAMGRLDHPGAAFDLVFTDVVMPGSVSGVDLAERVQHRTPRIPVLLTSGYADPVADDAAERFTLLSKPYRRADLARAIRHAIDRG